MFEVRARRYAPSQGSFKNSPNDRAIRARFTRGLSLLAQALNREPGYEEVAGTIPHAAISAVNLSEVVAKLADNGMPEEEIREALEGLALEVHSFGRELSYETGFLRPTTRSSGLSLGDRACLALGSQLELPVLTTDRAWEGLDIEAEIRLLRS